MNKKGQITIFIIIGLIIILTLILGFAVLRNVLKEKPPEEFVVAELPTELRPLGLAIEGCQESLLDDGIRAILATGGYLNPDLHGITPVLPGEGAGFALSDTETVAYWHYTQGGSLLSKKPPLVGTEQDAMNIQLAQYVDQRLDACVPWEQFTEYELDVGQVQSAITFREQTTTITSFWPITVTTRVGTTQLSAFQATIDAPVQLLYETAQDVIAVLGNERGPEHLTIGWLAVYATGEYNIPPMFDGPSFGVDVNIYPLEPAKTDIVELLTMMTDTMHVIGSRDAQIYESSEPAVQELYFDALTATTHPVDEMRIRAYYGQEYGMRYRVNDNPAIAIPSIFRPGGILAAFFPPIIDNAFFHDLEYPLLFRFEQNGYALQAGYEVNIQNNEPSESEGRDLRTTSYCGNPGGAQLTLRTSEPDIRAAVTYKCGSILCPVGTLTPEGLRATLPACANGELEATAPGLFSEQLALSSSAGEILSESITFYTPTEVQLDIRQRDLQPVFSIGDQPSYILSDVESAPPAPPRVILSRQGKPWAAIADENMKVTLVPGTYDVYIIGIQNFDPPYIIPEENRCVVSAGPVCITRANIPEVVLETLPVTYLQLEGENGAHIPYIPSTLRITAVGLYPDHLRNVDDLEMLSALFDLAEATQASDAVTLN